MVAFRLVVDPSDPRPIWRQIEEGVRLAIARRELAPGDAVPSVRELAELAASALARSVSPWRSCSVGQPSRCKRSSSRWVMPD